MGLTHKRPLSVIAKCDALKHILHPQQPDHPLRVVDVRVGEEPRLDLGSVNVRQQLSKLGVRGDDTVQGERIIDLAVEIEGIDLVVEDETGNGQAIVFVVSQMEFICLIIWQGEVGDEVVVWTEGCSQRLKSDARDE